MLLNRIKYKNKDKERTNFYASDMLKDDFELYHSFIGTPKTNDMDWKKKFTLDTRSYSEEAFADIVESCSDVEVHDRQVRLDMQYKSIRITGYCDFLFKIKGIIFVGEQKTYYSKKTVLDLERGYPQEHHAYQLATYCHGLGIDRGILFYLPLWIGEGIEDTFEFKCVKKTKMKYKVGKYTINLEKEFDRLVEVHKAVLERKEPQPKFSYKFPVESIDWTKYKLKNGKPNAELRKLLDGKKVLGDWQCKYSPYTEIYADRSGGRGYTAKEIEYIKSQFN